MDKQEKFDSLYSELDNAFTEVSSGEELDALNDRLWALINPGWRCKYTQASYHWMEEVYMLHHNIVASGNSEKLDTFLDLFQGVLEGRQPVLSASWDV